MIKDLQSKSEYFHYHLTIERNQLDQFKYEMKQLKIDALQCRERDKKYPFDNCYWISQPRFDSFLFYLVENNKHIHNEYSQMISPFQHLLIVLSFLNTTLIGLIWKQAIRHFLLSNFFALLILCINGQLVLSTNSNVHRILLIGLCLIFFSIWTLFKVIQTLSAIVHYRTIKELFNR